MSTYLKTLYALIILLMLVIIWKDNQNEITKRKLKTTTEQLKSCRDSLHFIQKNCTVILTERIKKISPDGMNLELKQPYEK